MYDVIIIGAGPAGSTLARLLPANLKTLIIDKRNLDESSPKKEKSCGGLINSTTQKMLAKFDIGLDKEVLVNPQVYGIKIFDTDNKLERFFQRDYINVDREKLDRFLVNKIPDTVTKHFSSTFKSYTEIENGYEVEYIKESTPLKARTQYLIAADGGNSLLRKTLYPKDRIKKYVSIQKWYKQNNQVNHYTSIFDRKVNDYYSWTIPKDDYLILGTAIDINATDKMERFKRLEDTLKEKGYDLSKEVKKEGSFILRPKRLSDIKLGKDNIFFIGEAAGLISPSSAEGFSYAMRSAVALSESILKKNVRKQYKKRLRKIKLTLLNRYLKLPPMYNRFLRKIIFKLHIMSINQK